MIGDTDVMLNFVATFFLLFIYLLIVIPLGLLVQFFRWLSRIFNPKVSTFITINYVYTKHDFNS